MAAKKGGFKSPKGVRKPQISNPGAAMGMPGMGSMGGMMGGKPFKKGGKVKSSKKC